MSINNKLNEVLNNIDIMDELENEHYIDNLNEMAFDLKTIEQKVTDKVDKVDEHLLKCLLLQDSTNCLKHWSSEVQSFLPRLYKIKDVNKRPDKKIFIQWINDCHDTLLNDISSFINDINDEENSNIKEYNSQALYNCILAYYDWLSSILPRCDRIEKADVYNEICLLIQKYNESK